MGEGEDLISPVYKSKDIDPGWGAKKKHAMSSGTPGSMSIDAFSGGIGLSPFSLG